jgi:hypothetical protein
VDGDDHEKKWWPLEVAVIVENGDGSIAVMDI